MQYISSYESRLGKIILTADRDALTGLYFEGTRDYHAAAGEMRRYESALIRRAKLWLDIYFSGRKPDFTVPLRQEGTPFQRRVWEILQDIPYGETTSYGEIARQIAKERGIPRMAAQAVGGAVGRNRILIMIPCHRVIGSDSSLTGFGGGLERKAALLALEKIGLS